MAGGRAGVKKMMGGGRAGMKKMKVGGSAKKEKMYDVEVDGKMYKFGFDSKPTSAALKKAAKSIGPAESVLSKKRTEKMIGKAGKTISNKDKKIVAGKKMGGRAGVVKMMNGGDPLSKRGVKMGMSMSPSKNKGKGLYGK